MSSAEAERSTAPPRRAHATRRRVGRDEAFRLGVRGAGAHSARVADDLEKCAAIDYQATLHTIGQLGEITYHPAERHAASQAIAYGRPEIYIEHHRNMAACAAMFETFSRTRQRRLIRSWLPSRRPAARRAAGSTTKASRRTNRRGARKTADSPPPGDEPGSSACRRQKESRDDLGGSYLEAGPGTLRVRSAARHQALETSCGGSR